MAAIPGPRERTEAKRVKDVLDLFDVCYEYSSPHLEEYDKVQQLYNQIIDPATWETSSEVTLGISFALVQNLLPAIMFYSIWGPDIPFELVPRDSKTDWKTARSVRDNLIYTQRERMALDVQGFYTILNAVKLGVGYTLVEPKRIQPGGFGVTAATAGGVFEQTRAPGLGVPVNITSCRNIPVGRVYPTPDGEDPESVSGVTVLDYMTEDQLRKAYQDKDHPYEGDAETIIAYARKNKLNGYTATARQIADYLCRHKQPLVDRMNSTGKNIPCLVPIVKQYLENRHVWVACDKFIMYEVEDKFQTLSKPICKATMAPEGGEWFTRGLVGRTFDTAVAIESWVNAMMDMLSLSLHPHQIINTNALVEEHAQEDIAPYGRSYVRGDPRLAMDFVRWPQLPAEAYQVPDQLRGFTREVAGSAPTATQSSTPGIVRGGTSALESLLQVSTGREKMVAKHVESGWYKQITLQTLIHQQVLVEEADEITVLPVFKPGTKPQDMKFEIAKITSDDIRQQWRVEMNFRQKLRNYIGEAAIRLQQADRLKDSEYVNPQELPRFILGDDFVADILTRGVDPDKRREEIMARINPKAAQEGNPLAPETAGRGLGLNV